MEMSNIQTLKLDTTHRWHTKITKSFKILNLYNGNEGVTITYRW